MNNDELIKRVERETRYLIGDQAVQIMVLRAALELQQVQQPREQPNPPPQPEPQKPLPNPTRPENPEPGHPGPSPDIPPPPPTRSPQPDPARNTKSNGHYQEKIAG